MGASTGGVTRITSESQLEKLRLREDYCLVRILAEKKTGGGLFIPETANQDQVVVGRIEACGPGRRKFATIDGYRAVLDERCPMETKAGDVVLMSKYQGDILELDNGAEFRIVDESVFNAIVELAEGEDQPYLERVRDRDVQAHMKAPEFSDPGAVAAAGGPKDWELRD